MNNVLHKGGRIHEERSSQMGEGGGQGVLSRPKIIPGSQKNLKCWNSHRTVPNKNHHIFCSFFIWGGRRVTSMLKSQWRTFFMDFKNVRLLIIKKLTLLFSVKDINYIYNLGIDNTMFKIWISNLFFRFVLQPHVTSLGSALLFPCSLLCKSTKWCNSCAQSSHYHWRCWIREIECAVGHATHDLWRFDKWNWQTKHSTLKDARFKTTGHRCRDGVFPTQSTAPLINYFCQL